MIFTERTHTWVFQHNDVRARPRCRLRPEMASSVRLRSVRCTFDFSFRNYERARLVGVYRLEQSVRNVLEFLNEYLYDTYIRAHFYTKRF